jgi:L-ascorbate metabolism protein UlaG (beta-lactamase superfamily)
MVEIGDVKLEFLGHSGFLIIDKNEKRIAIDPYNVSKNIRPVDFILITHSHYDHCSIRDIELLKKPDGSTKILIPADCQSKITRIEDIKMEIIEIGDELKLGNIKIEAIPSYNIEKDFHPKREGWVGYLVKLGDVVIYHTGDSDKIPEMKNLTGHGKHATKFVALLPVSGKYVMDSEEAAEVASLISPDLAIPMHYGAGVAGTVEDAERFVGLCKELNIRAEVLEKV